MKFEFIDEVQLFWKFWSLRLGAAGTVITSYLVLLPDSAINIWNAMPVAFQSVIPAKYMPMIGVVIFVLGMIARLLKQHRVEAATAVIKVEKAVDRAEQGTPTEADAIVLQPAVAVSEKSV